MASNYTLDHFDNNILTMLPVAERERLLARMELINLTTDQMLIEAGEPADYLFFPLNAVISLLALTNDGHNVEVGMVGHEGMVGLSTITRCPQENSSPYRAVVQISGNAMRIRSDDLHQELAKSKHLQQTIFCFLHLLLTQISQSGACNRFHRIEARFCRWLLAAQDRTRSNILTLTQESIANTLGARRAGINEAANILQKAGYITCSRGVITITNRSGLESACCECYRIIKAKMDEFLHI